MASNDRFERPKPDREFSEATLNAFMNSPVWKAIEDLWREQQSIVTFLVMNSNGENDEFFKGVNDQINYNLSLKHILMESKDESKEDAKV